MTKERKYTATLDGIDIGCDDLEGFIEVVQALCEHHKRAALALDNNSKRTAEIGAYSKRTAEIVAYGLTHPKSPIHGAIEYGVASA